MSEVETVGVTGAQLRRWREMKNLTRSQLICLLGTKHRERSTESIQHIEEQVDRFVSQWLVKALSMGKVRRVTVECAMDLFDWAQADVAGEEIDSAPHRLIEDVTNAPEPVAVDVDEPAFIAQLLRRQGYDVDNEQVRRWVRGEKPPAEVGTSLKSIQQNLGYLVRAAQAENIVRGVFSGAAFASIAKEDSFDRKLLSDNELRRAQGEQIIEMEHELRLPRRYYAIVKQMAHAVRLNTAELVNMWLERSIETVLQVSRIKTTYDELGLTPKTSRRNLFKFSLGRDKVQGYGREAVKGSEVKDG